jgi:hypothetical protein
MMIKTTIGHARGLNASKLHLSTSADMNVELCMVLDIQISLQCLPKNTYLEKVHFYLLVCHT